MSKKKAATLIFNKWKTDFIEFDKKKNAVKDNFDSLFYAMYAADIPFDIVYDIVDQAVAHHFPSEGTAKFMWKMKSKYSKMTYAEWLKGWRDDIKAQAHKSFYEFFPLAEHLDMDLNAKKPSNTEGSMATDDEMNEEDFYKSSKNVTRESPWLFDKEEG